MKYLSFEIGSTLNVLVLVCKVSFVCLVTCNWVNASRVLWCFVFNNWIFLQNKNKCCKYKHMLVGCWSAYWCHLLFLVQLLYYSIFTWHNLHTCFLFYLLFFAFVISHFLVLCFRFCFLTSCNDTHYNHW